MQLLVGLVCGASVLVAARDVTAQMSTQASDPAGAWLTFAGGNARNAVSRHARADVATPAWTLTSDNGLAIAWLAQQSPVVDASRVFAVGSTQAVGQVRVFYVFCVSRDTGAIVWRRALAQEPVLESQSSLAIDAGNGTVIVAAGNTIAALDVGSGAAVWSVVLPQSVVNASPLVTDDFGASDRVFVTTFSPGPVAGELVCINLDGFDAIRNPWQLGEVVCSVPLGNTSGNTPAMMPRRLGGNDLVVVATIGEAGVTAGTIAAFDAKASTGPAAAWAFSNTRLQGFFGGCTLAVTPSGGLEVFASSYAFSGGLTSANTVRLDARSGALLGETSTNRTNANPIVLASGRVALATGISGFGSVPSLLWLDASLGSSATLWNTASDTWVDLDGDGRFDVSEYLRLSGYNAQPAASMFGGQTLLVVPTIQAAGTTIASGSSLSVIDPTRTPVQAGFVVQQSTLAGGSVALAGPNMYSVGVGGLVAFGRVPAAFDVNGDKRRSIDDLYAWAAGSGARDVNGDGSVNAADRDALRALLRSDEVRVMEEAR
jgi:outer membrane protein assembly factor BamB